MQIAEKLKEFRESIRNRTTFMNYMRRDYRWLSLLIAVQIFGLSCFGLAMFTYLLIGLPAVTFCMILLLLSLACIVPAAFGLGLLYRQKLIRAGKILPKQKYAPASATVPITTEDGEYVAQEERA